MTSRPGTHSADVYSAPALYPAHPSSGDTMVDDTPLSGASLPQGRAVGGEHQPLGRSLRQHRPPSPAHSSRTRLQCPCKQADGPSLSSSSAPAAARFQTSVLLNHFPNRCVSLIITLAADMRETYHYMRYFIRPLNYFTRR